MGARGPAPTPSKVKILHGETRPSRVNYREPLPSGRPIMPAEMDEEAPAVWRRVMRHGGSSGVIRATDTDALRCYCEAVSRYNRVARIYARTDPVIKDRGHLVKNPLYQIVRESSDQVRMFARELGLTPSARSGLEVEPLHSVDFDPDLGPPRRLRVVADGK